MSSTTTLKPAPSAYGPICPFCSTAVAEYAAVCTGCGAHKGRRSETLGTGRLLIRLMVWCNTIGLLLFGMMLAFFDPWNNPAVLNGTHQVCVLDVDVQSHPPLLPALTSWQSRPFVLEVAKCEDVKDLAAAETRLFDVMSARILKETRNTIVKVEKGKTHTENEVNRSPTWAGYIRAIGRSLLALFIGGVLMKYVAHPLWRRIFGLVSDPMWVRK